MLLIADIIHMTIEFNIFVKKECFQFKRSRFKKRVDFLSGLFLYSETVV